MARRRDIVTGGARPDTGRHLGIVDVAEVCARFRAASLDLFARLGAWVADTDEPPLQRLFAEASHRHAWHAELWEARTPAIPSIGAGASTDAQRANGDDLPADRAGWYRAQLDELLAEIEATDVRVHRLLDPATHRVIQLVSADLRELRHRLAQR